MKRARLGRRALIAGLAAFLAVLALGLALNDGGGDDDASASSAALDRIAAKNREAAVDSAARLKAESGATAASADMRIAAESEPNLAEGSR
jgi:hypothetical protein